MPGPGPLLYVHACHRRHKYSIYCEHMPVNGSHMKVEAQAYSRIAQKKLPLQSGRYSFSVQAVCKVHGEGNGWP